MKPGEGFPEQNRIGEVFRVLVEETRNSAQWVMAVCLEQAGSNEDLRYKAALFGGDREWFPANRVAFFESSPEPAVTEIQQPSKSIDEYRQSGRSVLVNTITKRHQCKWLPVTIERELDAGKLYEVRHEGDDETVQVRAEAIYGLEETTDDPNILYSLGIEQADALLDDANDYARILWGLARVLNARWIRISPMELNELLHWPLASYSMQNTFQEISDALTEVFAQADGIRCILTGVGEMKISWIQNHLLSGELGHEFKGAHIFANHETELEAHIESMTVALETGRLGGYIEQARTEAPRLRRLVEIVQAIAGESDLTQNQLQLANVIEGHAVGLELRAREEIQRASDRLLALPIERAEQLQPIRDLKLRQNAFGGNRAEPDSDYITDGVLLIRKKAVKGKGRAERIAATKPKGHLRTFEEQAIRNLFRNAIEAARKPAQVLGQFHLMGFDSWSRKRNFVRLAALVTDDDQIVYVSADMLRFLDSLLGGFDELRVADHIVVLYKAGQAEGFLAPLRYGKDDIPLDLKTARRIASTFNSA